MALTKFSPIFKRSLKTNPIKSCISFLTNGNIYDLAIVGGGIVGLATAREIKIRFPHLNLVVLEKEKDLSRHQSGHNSGVIHAGIYYPPGSLKAKLCVEGLRLSYIYADEKKIPYRKCGKLIVAVEEHEIPKLDDLISRATINKVPGIQMVSADEIPQIEPHCRGLRAIYSPETGIIDWRQVALSYAKDFESAGGVIYTDFQADHFTEVMNADFPISIRRKIDNSSSNIPEVTCKYVIACAGLQSDVVAMKTGCSKHPKIVPFRGDYLLLKEEKCHLIKGNIYPVPDPRFPFLGVHFTPRIDGSVWLGPNAILSFKREGYGKFDISPKDTLDFLFYPGLLKIAWRFFGIGMKEIYRSIFLSNQVKLLQKYVPELQVSDVTRGPSGVRAQALSPQGNLVDDFVFDHGDGPVGKRVLNVRNAPSPAATSSLSIARMIVDRASEEYGLSSQK
ncbi:unnamed protein product [Protopolystoma xenopodis]|uniref:L-2-hydroxyglutarate dehydrogenase, mitochondrial n=1 Tax=Protopolystoma xenopodis TaxID=117903 RepID=A0A3S5BCJ0_9PLAT|nr:unnamed protein product [Protopolystoma xenopodis]